MSENPAFLCEQIVSYRGNKRNLLSLIAEGLGIAISRLGKPKLRILDAFSGSGICSRFFKRRADLLIANDIQPFACATARCFLANRTDIDFERLTALIADLESRKLDDHGRGFIARLYAPVDDENITTSDRAFFTAANARILDNVCSALLEVDEPYRSLVTGPLLAEVSIRSNTAGHFAGYFKDRYTKVGAFGGTHAQRKQRIITNITLAPPILSNYECDVRVFQQDANKLVKNLDDLDVAYFDPPYGGLSYGMIYFMLNRLVTYEEPQRVSKESGIPKDWIRSGYESKFGNLELLERLTEATPARFILISYSNEGRLQDEEIRPMLERHGTLTVLEQKHARYSSARQRGVTSSVLERVYVLEKR
jgi:adenine-specific DNA-methyltransferase